MRLSSFPSTFRGWSISAYLISFLAIGQAEGDIWGQVFNAGSGCDASIADVAALLQRIVGTQVPVVVEPERVRPEASEVMRLQADATHLAKATSWSSRVRLEDGLRLTVEWWRRRQGVRTTDGSYKV